MIVDPSIMTGKYGLRPGLRHLLQQPHTTYIVLSHTYAFINFVSRFVWVAASFSLCVDTWCFFCGVMVAVCGLWGVGCIYLLFIGGCVPPLSLHSPPLVVVFWLLLLFCRLPRVFFLILTFD